MITAAGLTFDPNIITDEYSNTSATLDVDYHYVANVLSTLTEPTTFQERELNLMETARSGWRTLHRRLYGL